MSNEEILICIECDGDSNMVDALCDECKLCADCCQCEEGFLQDGERFLPAEDDEDELDEEVDEFDEEDDDDELEDEED